ncbi:MAG: hypothetical protein WC282_00330 [Bacilli bacterium]
MASKLGLILSFLFVINVFILFGDLINIQIIYANLDAVSMTAGQLIVVNGGITHEVADYVAEYANGEIKCRNNCTPRFGDTYIYDVTTSYEAIIISDEPLIITITRSVVIGYYN